MKYIISTSLFATLIAVAYFPIQTYSVLPLTVAGISLGWLLSRFIGMYQELNLLKEENLYFADSFQNIRSPISMIHTPLKNICNDSCPDNIKSELLLTMRHLDSLNTHLGRLMNLKLLFIHSANMDIEEHELGGFLESKIDTLKVHASGKLLKIKIERTFSYGSVWIDPNKITPLIEIFIMEAIDNSLPEKEIILSIALNHEHWEIKISGYGKGRILKSALSKKLLKMCNGEIIINNPERTVSLRFPVEHSGKEQTARTIAQIDRNRKEEKIDTIFYKASLKRNSSKPMVVIVDSNDEFNAYLERCLSGDFTVRSFNNGAEALTGIKEEYPDLVICDTMLHGMRGNELSSRLKTSRETSIIPIILYGSHIDTDQRSTREASLADTFLQLPFNMEDLKTEMSVLIKNSRSLRKAFLQKVFGELFLESDANDTLNENNHLFINQVKEFVLRNVDNENLTIDDIAANLCMSRTAFFNKWKSLTGEAPKFFIYRIRMEKARELLESGKCSVNVVPEMIGLKNLKNFRHKYKEYFGITPSESILKK